MLMLASSLSVRADSVECRVQGAVVLGAATADVSAGAHGVEVKPQVDGGGHPGGGQAGVHLLHVVPHSVVMAG